MSTIENFEDLIAWQKARKLTAEIYRVTEAGRFAKDFGLKGQIQRAAVSIMSNIAEGFEHHRRTEFHRYLGIAVASCGELRSQLYVALDVGYLTQQEFDPMMEHAREVTRIVSAMSASQASSK